MAEQPGANGGGFPMGGMPGLPPGMSMEALQDFMQDPNVQRMTQAIASDPVFMEMAKAMQESMLAGGMGGLNLGGESEGEGGAAEAQSGTRGAGNGLPPGALGGMPGGMPGMMGGMGGMPGLGVDPGQYMQAMQRVMQNPEFMQAAESLGRTLMQQTADPETAGMLELLGNPENQPLIKAKLEELKDDPELKEVMEDIEQNGQAAFMKYMNDPEVMSKMGRRFQEVMNDPEVAEKLGLPGAAGAEGEEEEEEEEEEVTVFSLASTGDEEGLAELLKQEGVDPNEKDAEGRTALHFASGYGELGCMKTLIAAGADVNAKDDNENTALHYAAGYGNSETAGLLLEHKADVNAKNAEGKTALEVAEMNEQDAVVTLLKVKAEEASA